MKGLIAKRPVTVFGLALIAVGLVGPAVLSISEGVKLYGYVTNHGERVAGVHIWYGASSPISVVTTTNQNGYYEMGPFPVGTWVIGCRYPEPSGEMKTQTITMYAGGSARADFWFNVTAPAPAPQTGGLHGWVTNYDGSRVQGVVVHAGVYPTTTDGDGYFRFDIPAGNYIVSCGVETVPSSVTRTVSAGLTGGGEPSCTFTTASSIPATPTVSPGPIPTLPPSPPSSSKLWLPYILWIGIAVVVFGLITKK